MRVLICGNFGHPVNVDGQSIKTRTLTDAFTRVLGNEAVMTVDTASVYRQPLSFYLKARRAFAKCSHVVVLRA